ncbi:hypothetical protein J6590_078635 [Homalodisca vitripennis]|nr:hypothetical protein J6590_078635 [Homalodisca vitripennis]
MIKINLFKTKPSFMPVSHSSWAELWRAGRPPRRVPDGIKVTGSNVYLRITMQGLGAINTDAGRGSSCLAVSPHTGGSTTPSRRSELYGGSVLYQTGKWNDAAAAAEVHSDVITAGDNNSTDNDTD